MVLVLVPVYEQATTTSCSFLHTHNFAQGTGWRRRARARAPPRRNQRRLNHRRRCMNGLEGAMNSTTCLKSQGSGRWTTAARAHHEPRGWHFSTPLGEGLNCKRNSSGSSDFWHPSIESLGFDFDHCPLQKLDTGRLCKQLAGRHLLFVGDSTNMHLFVEFYMMVNQSRINTNGMCKFWACHKQWICTDHVPGGVPIEVVRDEWLSVPNDRAVRDAHARRPIVHSTSWSKTLTNKTVLIITHGAHYWKRDVQWPHTLNVAVSAGPTTVLSVPTIVTSDGNSDELLCVHWRARIQERLRHVMAATPGLAVVYRSALAGHRNCTNAKSPLSNLTDARAAEYMPRGDVDDKFSLYGWSDIDALRPAQDDAYRRIGAAILESWTPASYRPDMHPTRPDKLKGHTDCLHFCPGEQVYFTWALTLANMIQEWQLLAPRSAVAPACASACNQTAVDPTPHEIPPAENTISNTPAEIKPPDVPSMCEHPKKNEALKQDMLFNGSVCVFNGSLWTGQGRPVVKPMFDWSGRRWFRIEVDRTLVSSPTAVWHDNGILSWTSHVDHVNHFIGETLGPVFSTTKRFNLTNAWIVLAGAESYTYLSEEHTLFTWLLTVLPTDPRVFVARTPNESRPAPYYKPFPPSRLFDSRLGTGTTLMQPHCFRCAWIQNSHWHASMQTFFSEMASRARERYGICNAGRGYSLLLQRARTRRIENVEELAAEMKRHFGLPVVVADFMNRTAQQQMELACGARVFLGVQGQGMEWAHFVNGGSGAGLVLELYWSGWPIYYTQLMQSANLWAIDLPAGRRYERKTAKYDNVYLDLTHIKKINLSTPTVVRSSLRQKASAMFKGAAAITKAAASYL